MTSKPTVMRLGESMPCPSCSRRFGKVHPILHPPPPAAVALSRALGVVVCDVVLSADEICGLTAGLLVSHQPALGRVSLLEWLKENASRLGWAYANELDRHFRVRG
jgi:hypothetical protein